MQKARARAADAMRPEYDFSDAVRGKYFDRYKASSNVVVLDADVSEVFPNAKAVNQALRVLASAARTQGGQPSSSHRREVDLYVHTDDLDALYERLKDRVEVVEGPHDTFYGMREFIIRDLNRFWITFGQPAEKAS